VGHVEELRANSAEVEEVAEMPDAFERMLERHGFIAKWKDEGLEKGRKEAVKKLRKHGMKPAEIARVLELPPATVTGYLRAK
jgi:hypothetical protein